VQILTLKTVVRYNMVCLKSMGYKIKKIAQALGRHPSSRPKTVANRTQWIVI